MKLRIDEIGSILDDYIDKHLCNHSNSIEDMEDRIEKTLTFNPANISEVNNIDNGQYHVPYMMADDGGFYPHPVEHWTDQGKNPNDYKDVRDFYQNAGINQDNYENLQLLHTQGNKFSFIRNSLKFDLIKSENIVIEMNRNKELVIEKDMRHVINIDLEPLIKSKKDIIRREDIFISDGLIFCES